MRLLGAGRFAGQVVVVSDAYGGLILLASFVIGVVGFVGNAAGQGVGLSLWPVPSE